jgi:heme/copper-type cytochrome/quinol oxidase subunit 2
LGIFGMATFIVVLVIYLTYVWRYRAKRPGQDRSGWWAYHNRPLGWVLKILGLVILVGSFTIDFTSGSSDRLSRDFSNLIFAAGGIAFILGFQMSLLEPDLADRDPSSRPIFYLRAFDDDNRTNLQPGGLLAGLQGIPSGDAVSSRSQTLFYLYPIRLIRMFFNRIVETSEEQLAGFFSQHGPFLAIGKPGETFSSPGALRIYVRNDQWQATVMEILAHCKAVVLQPAKTRGIWWEVEQVLAGVAPERILICLVNFKNRPDDYEQFRRKIEPLLPVALPRVVPFLDTCSFLYFEQDWTPRLQLLSYRSPFLWGISGDATDLNYTLAPFIQGVEGQARPLPNLPKDYRLQKWIVTILLLALNVGLVLLVLAALQG